MELPTLPVQTPYRINTIRTQIFISPLHQPPVSQEWTTATCCATARPGEPTAPPTGVSQTASCCLQELRYSDTMFSSTQLQVEHGEKHETT